MKKMAVLMASFLAVFSFVFTNASLLSTTGSVHAATDCTIDNNGNPTNCDGGGGSDVNKKIYKFGATVSGVVVGVALLMIIYGGFKYVTSQGDPRATETAKNQIMFAGIGMLIVMMAFVIMKLFTGATGSST